MPEGPFGGPRPAAQCSIELEIKMDKRMFDVSDILSSIERSLKDVEFDFIDVSPNPSFIVTVKTQRDHIQDNELLEFREQVNTRIEEDNRINAITIFCN